MNLSLPHQSAEVAPSPDVGGARFVVHVVDDDEAVRRSLALLLSSCGFETITYRCAEDILAHAPALPAGCLIVDVRMPGMDGLT
jgi:two-component system response regulator FixJ